MSVSGFNKYAAGSKSYGSGRSGPNVGKTSSPGGYAKRDNKIATASAFADRNQKATGMRNALLRKHKERQKGNYASSAAQTPAKNLFSGPGGN